MKISIHELPPEPVVPEVSIVLEMTVQEYCLLDLLRRRCNDGCSHLRQRLDQDFERKPLPRSVREKILATRQLMLSRGGAPGDVVEEVFRTS